MNITNNAAYDIITSVTHDTFTPKRQRAVAATEAFIEKYQLHLDKNEFKTLLRKYERLLSVKVRDRNGEAIFYEVKGDTEVQRNEEEITPKRKVGRPVNDDFSSICRRTKRIKIAQTTDDIIPIIEGFATRSHITNETALNMVVRSCRDRWGLAQELNDTKRLPLLEATAFMYNNGLSTRQYQETRMTTMRFGFILPPRNEIDKFKADLYPTISEYELKSSVDYEELLSNTFIGLMDVIGDVVEVSDSVGMYELAGKFGADGSSSHKHRHQKVNRELAAAETPHINPDRSESYLLATYCPQYLHQDGVVIWKNPCMNSIQYTRPVGLLRAHEDIGVLKAEFSSIFDSINNNLETVVQYKGKTVKLFCSTVMSGCDGKMVGFLQGDTGAPCHYCSSDRATCNDMANIVRGFIIDKSFAECTRIWEDLQSGEMDFNNAARGGQCHEPLVECKFFGVMHKELRSLDFLQKLYYRLIAGTYDWCDSKKNRMKPFVDAAKQQAINHIMEECGFLMDTPSSAGGNTNSGGVAKRFLDPTNRDKICSIISNEVDRENYADLLRMFNLMLTVTQQTERRPNHSKVRTLGIDLMSHIKTGFLDNRGRSWVPVINSVHEMAAHSWQLMQILEEGTMLLGHYTEQNQEAWNKYISAFKSGPACRARQSSVRENTKDILTRMLIITHPKIASMKRTTKCSKCGQTGHTARSYKFHQELVLAEEDTAIDDMFVQ